MQEAARLARKLEDPNAKWIDFEDFSAMLAADAVVEARKKAGLTQGQLAAKLKMPQSQISRIERNPDRTTVRTLKKIAKALGVDVAKLI
jgi:ribosome-binding protein aMBF1 (putative translation factor)